MKAERFVRTAIVQLFPFVGIDVVHHPVDVCLGQVIKACPFGQDPADQFMIDFNRALLVRASGIAIINAGTTGSIAWQDIIPLLYLLRIRELASVVSYDDRE